MSLEPLARVEAADLLREVDEALIPLLRGLAPADWNRSAVGTWRVRDVAAHLLDGALRRLSLDRDGYQPPPPETNRGDYDGLVGYLNELNTAWVGASQRLSPAVLTDLLEVVCPLVADYFDSLDPEGTAAFAVSWAGEAWSKVWMDVAREFTERWHHQQQIREAVGATWLDEERFVKPLLETFMRALPRAYAELQTDEGSAVLIEVVDIEELAWILQRCADSWVLGRAGSAIVPRASIHLPAESVWRLFTKGIDGETARESAELTGDEQLAGPFFEALAVMA